MIDKPAFGNNTQKTSVLGAHNNAFPNIRILVCVQNRRHRPGHYLVWEKGETREVIREAKYSRAIAEKVGTEHQEIVVFQRDLLDAIPGAIRAMDQPTMDGINTYFISRQVRAAGVKVALFALGGDEMFAGYPSFLPREREDARPSLPMAPLGGNDVSIRNRRVVVPTRLR